MGRLAQTLGVSVTNRSYLSTVNAEGLTMATLFFARTGTRSDRAGKGRQVPIEVIVRGLGGHQTHFYDEPPEINPGENPSTFSPYTHTVVQIEASETCVTFPTPGYYVFHSVRPAECLAFLGLAER